MDGEDTAARAELIRPTYVSSHQFEAAHACVAEHAHHTPMLRSGLLNEATGLDVQLKAELFQRTGSYKIRGALNKIRTLTEEQRARGVICSSAGNHAQGVALAAALNGVKAVVVMATNATPSKIAATRAYGAEVVLQGNIWDEANEEAMRLVQQHGYTFLHPFDDLDLIAGQGTVGLEIVEDVPGVETIVVPVGGGGLVSGIAAACAPDVRVVAVEPETSRALHAALEAGEPVAVEPRSAADALNAPFAGRLAIAVCQALGVEVVLVSEDEIAEAFRVLYARAKLACEPGAAAGLAAVLAGRVDGGRTVCVVSGGNVAAATAAGILAAR